MESQKYQIWNAGKPHSKDTLGTLPQEVVTSLLYNHMTLTNLFISNFRATVIKFGQ